MTADVNLPALCKDVEAGYYQSKQFYLHHKRKAAKALCRFGVNSPEYYEAINKAERYKGQMQSLYWIGDRIGLQLDRKLIFEI